MKKVLIMVLGWILSSQGGFYDDHARGWHWYEKMEKKDPKHSRLFVSKDTPTQMMQKYRQELYRRRDTALVYPTLENVKAYQEMQQHWVKKSQTFAHRWQEVLLRYPHLDETVQYPFTQRARHVYLDEKEKAMQELFKKVSHTYGLFFFFKKDCPYCQSFAPLVKEFSHLYGFTVLPISLDGQGCEEFPEYVKDNGLSQRLNVRFVPSLFLVNPYQNHVFPLAHGMISLDDIKERLFFLLRQEEKRL